MGKGKGAAVGLLTGSVTRGSVSDGNGVELGVSSFKSVSRVRGITGKPHLLRLLSVDVAGKVGDDGEDYLSTASTSNNLTNADLFRLSFGNSATVTPRLGRAGALSAPGHNSSVNSASDPMSPPDVTYPCKEVALGCSLDHEAMFDYAYDALPRGDFPGQFRVSDQGGEGESGGRMGTCTLRLLPSPVSTLIFRVPSYESALDRQEIEDSVSGKIGFRANKTGQLLLSPPFAGLDLRLCESSTSDQSFDEGNAVLMENVLRGIGDTAHDSQLSCGAVLRKEFVGLAKKDKL